MNMLLDQSIKMKTQSQNPIHIIELRKVIMAAFEKIPTSTDTTDESNEDDQKQNIVNIESNENENKTNNNSYSRDIDNTNQQLIIQNKISLITKLEKLLNRIVNTQGIDIEMMHSVWDATAVFYQLLKKNDQCKDCRVKQVIRNQ